jgi:hypothetical protein
MVCHRGRLSRNWRRSQLIGVNSGGDHVLRRRRGDDEAGGMILHF